VSELSENRSLVWDSNADLRVISAHSRDLPSLLLSGVCDYILTGLDYAAESGITRPPIACLPKCCGEITALIKEKSRVAPSPTIVSQYPNIASRWAFQRGLDAIVHTVSGAAELYPRLGLADIAVDVVASGATYKANDLQELEVILRTSCAIFGALVEGEAPAIPPWLSRILQAATTRAEP
jgi:ATP phosphoribosyltransferase